MNIRRLLPGLLCMVLGTFASAAEKDLSEYPEMSPERCAERPPTELYQRLISAAHRLPAVSSSLAGQDDFCAVYQQQLEKYTDAHYPRAREYRKPMTAAFLNMVHFIEEIYGHNAIKHLYNRSGADIEWIILEAEKCNYKPFRESDYRTSEVEQFAQLMASGNDNGPGRRRRQAMPHLYEALKQFSLAVTDDERSERTSYFAHALIKFMAETL